MFAVHLFTTEAGRSQPSDFLAALPERDRAFVAADIATLAEHGIHAPVSVRPIKGHANRGMMEIRTGGFRTFYCIRGRELWILHVCKKQDQDAGIGAASARMRQL